MAVPSKNWTDILDTQVAADAPLDTTLLTEIRDNLVNLKEWLGFGFTAAQAHNHDAVNSASVVLADAIVSVAKLKMTQGSYTGAPAGGTQVAVALNRYAHSPVVGASNNSQYVFWFYEGGSGVSAPNAVLRVVGANTGAAVWTAHITWDYHAA